jgi:hypothetical protein
MTPDAPRPADHRIPEAGLVASLLQSLRITREAEQVLRGHVSILLNESSTID